MQTPLLLNKSIMLEPSYTIEIANGKLLSANTIIQGATLILNDYPFTIDVIPMTLGCFDIVVGMDWLPRNRAAIIMFRLNYLI